MDLEIRGLRAIVCASSRGLGKACAKALAREGCDVVINGRKEAPLAAAAEEIALETGRRPVVVRADLNSEAGRAALLESCPDPDILINNNGGPAPGRMSEWDRAAWLAAVEANMLAPILMIQAVVSGMRARRFGRIVNITSAMVKAPKLAMGLSTAARAGLTAFAKALSREAAADNVTLNNLLPERIDTDRLSYMLGQHAKQRGISLDQARSEMMAPIAARRFGRPEELADACAFLCSRQAGYISGQNIQIDGASYDGLF